MFTYNNIRYCFAKYIASLLKKRYGAILTPYQVHLLMFTLGFHTVVIKGHNVYTYGDVKTALGYKKSIEDFMYELERDEDYDNIVKSLDKKSKKEEQDDLVYRNDEDDMVKHSKYLEKRYQTESKDSNTHKIIYITEEQFKSLISLTE